MRLRFYTRFFFKPQRPAELVSASVGFEIHLTQQHKFIAIWSNNILSQTQQFEILSVYIYESVNLDDGDET